jgi:hypothetical protein
VEARRRAAKAVAVLTVTADDAALTIKLLRVIHSAQEWTGKKWPKA